MPEGPRITKQNRDEGDVFQQTGKVVAPQGATWVKINGDTGSLRLQARYLTDRAIFQHKPYPSSSNLSNQREGRELQPSSSLQTHFSHPRGSRG